jgi:hypothetical protein
MWNETKFKTFYIMTLRQSNGAGTVTPYELAYLTGCNTQSLLGLLPKWWRWHYISRVSLKRGEHGYTHPDGRWTYVFFGYNKVLSKGTNWLRWFNTYFPKLAARYLKEMKIHQTSIRTSA